MLMRSFAHDSHRARGARAPYNTIPRAPGPADTLINSIILSQCLKWLQRLCSGGLAWFRAWFRPGSAWLCPSVCTQTPRASSFAAWFRPWFRLVPGALLGRNRVGCGASWCRSSCRLSPAPRGGRVGVGRVAGCLQRRGAKIGK